MRAERLKKDSNSWFARVASYREVVGKSTAPGAAAFDAVFRAEGLEVIRTPVRAPNANARCERWISSAQRECLDRLLILGRRHLEAVLAEHVVHYNGCRPIAAWSCVRRGHPPRTQRLSAVQWSAGGEWTG
jgi:Integrase core domain